MNKRIRFIFRHTIRSGRYSPKIIWKYFLLSKQLRFSE